MEVVEINRLDLAETEEDRIQEIRKMTQGMGWKILLDHLRKQCKHRELALSAHLRGFRTEEAIALQNQIDGINMAEKVANEILKSKNNPNN